MDRDLSETVVIQVINTTKMRGRAAYNETKDCTVRAVASALSLPYADVHYKAALAGRCGSYFAQMITTAIEEARKTILAQQSVYIRKGKS